MQESSLHAGFGKVHERLVNDKPRSTVARPGAEPEQVGTRYEITARVVRIDYEERLDRIGREEVDQIRRRYS